MNALNGVFVHPSGLNALRRLYRRFARFSDTAADITYASKRFMMRTAFLYRWPVRRFFSVPFAICCLG